ncbi:hypothetical protein [Thalassotalea fusca]
MNNWIFYVAIAFVIVMIVGNFSTFNRGAKKPMRKQSLNDLKETLPRTNKTKHKMSTANTETQTTDNNPQDSKKS